MDTAVDEQIDYEDEEYGGAQKNQYERAGAIPALADDEMMGEDDDYDDLYSDVNVGESFKQMQQSEAHVPPQPQKVLIPEPRTEVGVSQGSGIPGGLMRDGKYSNAGRVPTRESEMGSVQYNDQAPISQKGRVMDMNISTQVGNLGVQGLPPASYKTEAGPTEIPSKFAGEPAQLLHPINGGPSGAQQMPTNQMRVNMSTNMTTNVIHPAVNNNQIRPVVENGSAMLFIGELHWWTTDAELESVLVHYGRVKEIKFFDERASGKSKGYCQVEFFDSAAAAACKEQMNGYLFNGRACVVAFASPQTLKQMGASYVDKNQAQPLVQNQARRPMIDGVGRGGGMNYSGGDSGRNFGRGGWGRGGQGMANRGPGGGPQMRGRGGAIGGRGIVGNNVGIGNAMNPGAYGQGLTGPPFGGPAGAMNMMHPQGMMGAGFDPTYMVGGGAYGGFPGAAFPGMLPSFPAVNTMGLAGVAPPHVNPAFFARGMAPNGMGMMGPTGMDGHHAGMWPDNSMGVWGGEEHGRTRESSYVGDEGASDYGHGEGSHEKGVRSNPASREKERGSEPDWAGHASRRNHDDREHDGERSDRDKRYREERDERDNRHRDRDSVHEDDRDRGKSSRSHYRARDTYEDDHRSRSRDVDYGKRRRLPSE